MTGYEAVFALQREVLHSLEVKAEALRDQLAQEQGDDDLEAEERLATIERILARLYGQW